MTKDTISIGDTVTVGAYTCTTMNGDIVKGWASGRTGVVTALQKRYAWQRAPNEAQVRFLVEGESHACSDTVMLELLVLVTKGDGTFVIGVTQPFSQQELRLQRWTAFEAKARAVDLKHCGFSNAATYLAWQYLVQEPAAHARMLGLRRKDGTVNPNKVQKLFSDLHLVVDAWAFGCPVEPPAEFAHNGNPASDLLALNWTEVAQEFRLELPVEEVA